MRWRRTRRPLEAAEHAAAVYLDNVRTGRFERSLSGLAAVGALVTGAEIWLEHDRASFANHMMWIPVAMSPVAAAAGFGGVFSRRIAKTALPLASAAVVANGLQGTYLQYETDPAKLYRCGFSIQCVSPLPVTFAEHVLAQGHWGVVLREYMRDYIHWATLGALCEFLPLPDNRVTLDAETDRHGMPVARFSYSQCDNDRELMKSAAATAESILTAAGAEEVITIDRYAHLVGGARMGDRPETGVVDRNLRSFAVPNLWITDGSTLPTQGAANPALTIMALVARAADVMVRRAGEGS